MPQIDRVIPVLVCSDIEAEHDFLVRAFGFSPGRFDADKEGKVIHGEVMGGGTTFWLHREVDEFRLAAPRRMPMNSCGYVVHVRDVDAHCAQALAAGAEIESEPRDQPYGQREYGARDPEGNRWWFATPLTS